MKKIFFLVACVMIVQGCTRASKSESAKIEITLPTSANVMQSVAGAGVSSPANLGEINCYGVFAGGPEPEMSVNKCAYGTRGSNGDVVAGEFKFSKDWVAGVPSGQTLSMDLPSGKDRVITLIGMKVANISDCKDFHGATPDDSQASEPYLLGSADRIELKPGETTQVPITMTLDSSKVLIGCEGPSAPPSNSSGGGGDNNNGPYLRLHGIGNYNSALDLDLATIGVCYPVRAALFSGHGNQWYNTESTPVIVNVGSVSFGQFYSDVSCSTAATQLLVPPSATESNMIYFKPTASVADVSLKAAGVTVSGVTTTFSLDSQKFKTGFRRIVISGPAKAVLNQCYPYKLTSSRFEGGELDASSSGEFGTLSTSANYILKQDPGCSGSVAPAFSPGQREIFVYGKMAVSAAVDLGSKISFPGYTIDSFPIQPSVAGNHYDRLELAVENNQIVRGRCVRGSIRIVNHDGGAVNTGAAVGVTVKVPQGAGVFYLSPSCNSGEVNQFTIPANASETSFWFRAHAVPLSMLDSGNLWITMIAGSLTQGNSAFKAIPVVDGMYSDWIAPAPPSFSGAEIVGDHEFTDGALNKDIPLLGRYDGLMDVTCASAEFGTYTSCSASELDRSSIPFKYKWSAANAISNLHRWVKFEYNGYWRTFRISRDALYGPNFKVLHCDNIAGTAAGQSIATLDGFAGPVVCLPQNVTFSKNNSNGYTISPVKTSLIGHSNGNSYLDANGYGGNMINVNGTTMTSDYTIANIRFNGMQGSTSMVNINSSISAASPYTIEINNVGGIVSAAGVRGLVVNYNTNPFVYVRYRNSSLYMTGAASVGVNSLSSSNVTLEDLDIQLTTSASGGYGIIFDNQGNMPADNLTVQRVKSTVASSSLALKVYNSNVSSANTLIVKDSVFRRTGNGDSNYPVAYLLGRFDFASITNNVFIAENVPNQALLSLHNGAYSPVFHIIGNTFSQSQPDKPALRQETQITYGDFTKNSFAYTGTGAFTTSGAIDIGSYAFSGTTTSPDPSGENIFCSISSNNFPVKVAGSGGITGITFATAPSNINNVGAGSYRCMGPAM